MNRIKLLLVAFFTVAVLAGCSGNIAARDVHQNIDGNFTMKQVETAIINAGRSRGWNMTKKRNGLITGKIVTRGNSAEIRIPYSISQYSIEYVGSQNLTEDTPRVPSNYNRWSIKLKQSIQNELMRGSLR